MIAALYRGLTTLAAPLVRALLAARARRGKEDQARLGERMGLASRTRPPGPLIWLHAASVGEAQSILALLGPLADARMDAHFLVTTGTRASARMLDDRLAALVPGGRAFHQYVPVDRAPWVRAFLDHWRPDLALWVESELWPNLVLDTQARGLPMILLNGRMSPRSFRHWRWARGCARTLLGGFALCFAQSAAEGERLRILGAKRVLTPGNLKYAADALPFDPAAEAALSGAIGTRPVWLAASTHAGEEKIAAAAHGALAARWPDLLTVIVPRHPARGMAIVRELAALGHAAIARRGTGELPGAKSGIYVADTMGELGLFYRLCPIVFVGGSLVPHGGQNLLEPARLGRAILHGPHMHNFTEIVGELSGAAEEIADGAALAPALARLLGDNALRAQRGKAAQTAAEAGRFVIERIMAELHPFLQALPGK